MPMLSEDEVQKLLLMHDKMILMRVSPKELLQLQLKKLNYLIRKTGPPFAAPFRLLAFCNEQIVADSLCTQMKLSEELTYQDAKRSSMSFEQIEDMVPDGPLYAWKVEYFHTYYRPTEWGKTVPFPPEDEWIRFVDGMLINK